MRRRLFIVLLVLLPAVAGFILWLGIRLDWFPDYLIYLRASLGGTMLVFGLALTALLGVGWGGYAFISKRSQKRLADAHAKAIERHYQFLRRLDHELKNPLTAMQIEVANLDAELSDRLPSEKYQAMPRLKDQMARLSELVIQLRKLGELESRPIEREPVRIDEILVELVEEFQASVSGTQREITLSLPQIPWPLPNIEGDADLVYLALRNLLNNAVKFTQPGDAIQVRAFDDSTQVTVEIADTGPGIPEDELPYVWDELYRGKLARGLPGSGLGLAIVKAIIDLHEGRVSLRSRVEQGTVITIRLPTAK